MCCLSSRLEAAFSFHRSRLTPVKWRAEAEETRKRVKKVWQSEARRSTSSNKDIEYEVYGWTVSDRGD
jgi:hypothetical protein